MGKETSTSKGGYPAGTKFYRALLTQTGTNPPVATILTNTLGGVPVWTRVTVGIYNLTLINAFPLNRTIVMTGTNSNDTFGDSGVLGATVRVRTSDSVIAIDSGSSGTPDDNTLVRTPIDITVYPP